MAQTIKIKRSTGSSAPSTLANGELAYLNHSSSKKLYIGRPGGGTGDIDVIGGKDFTDKLDLIGAANGSNAADASVVASTTKLGVIRIGDGLSIASNGVVSADEVTTASVTAAGALMDSEVTNLAQVKAFSSADYATAAQGTLATNALPKAGGTLTGDLVLGDDNKVQFGGTTTNLEIYNDGTTSYITENASGNLEIKATDFTIKDGGSQTMMSFDADGSLRIYDQSAADGLPVQRFGTTSTGVTINGQTKTTSLKMGNETVSVSSIKDQDNMSSNSATALATQQSIKAYVDNATTMGNFTFTDDEIISSGSTMTLDPHDDGITGTVVINGNLEVKGVTTTIESTTVKIDDNYIQLNSAQDENSAPPTTMFCGIQVDRGNKPYDSGIYWVESSDEWVVNTGGAGINRLIHDSNFEAKYPTLDGGTF